MKAAVYHRYGSPDVVELEDLPTPDPADDEVRLEVHAAALNPLDSHFMRGNPPVARIAMGINEPKMNRPGVDVAGVVEAVGRSVTHFKPGDEVFGACRGACSEYVVTREKNLVPKPASIGFVEAAAVPVAGLTALQGLRDKARLKPAQRVLIHGAAGGCGTFAVQIGKWLGADVTGVCRTENVPLLESIGADHVVDYTQENFTKGEPRYDVIFDFVSNYSIADCYRVLRRDGLYLAAGMLGVRAVGDLLVRPLEALARMPFAGGKRYAFLMAKGKKEDLMTLQELLGSGKIKSVIDRTYPLEQTAEALRHLETKHARGKIVIRVR
jgi:NADPH:quinone reductase-like Zn-dependent oxidoreductase